MIFETKMGGLIMHLCVDTCIDWNEAGNDCLIGPKPWDRIDMIFETKME